MSTILNEPATLSTFEILGFELEGAKYELLGRRRDVKSTPAVEECEAAALDSTRDTEVALGEQDARQLRLITAALARLEAGTYGLCLDCGELIPVRRLRAVPWAERCVSCQEAHEKPKGVTTAGVDWSAAVAAGFDRLRRLDGKAN